MQDAPLILLDKPFTAIDARATADLLSFIEGWHDQGRTVIAAIHDHDQIRRQFPDTLLLARKCVAWAERRLEDASI